MVRIWVISALVTLGVGAGLGLGCGGVGDLTISNGGATGAGGGSSSGASGVPCDVASALSICVTCHGDPPIGGALGSLLTYTDLKADAPSFPGTTMAQMAVTRMSDTAKPMPPTGLPAATSAQITALSSWIAAGYPMGTCGADAGPPDTTFTGAPTCPSGSLYPGGDGSRMDPGMPCISCHANSGGEAPAFTFAGTVFANGHATDRCQPSSAEQADLANAHVIITGANSATLTLSLGTATKGTNGNFSTAQSVPLPYTAKVVYFQGPNMGKERDMVTPQMSGDCNSCHTVAGTNNAPGRIALPQ